MHRSITRALASAATVALAGGLAACAAAEDGDEAQASSLRIALPGGQFDVNFTDASHGGATFYLTTQAVYEPLVARSAATNELEPWLAADYSIAEDSLSMDLTLREDVVFTDGETLDAEGVVEVLQAAFTGAESWARASVGDAYGAAASVAGDHSVRITTTRPIRLEGFVDLLEFIPIVSPAALDDDAVEGQRPAGTGPYLVEEIVPDVSISYAPNPDYWNDDLPVYESLEVVMLDDQVAALNALKSGQVDAAEIDMDLAAETEASGLTVHTGQFGLNTLTIVDHGGRLVPPLGDVRVRRAMNMAFDRARIAETIDHGFGLVSSQPFHSSRNEYVEGGDDRYPYDLEAARELMAEAGYENGFTLPIPTYAGVSTEPYHPIVEQSLADIGIAVEWVPFADHPSRAAATTAFELPTTIWFRNFDTGVTTLDPAFGFPADSPITDPEFVELMDVYRNGTLSEFEDVQPQLAEYILDQALYVPFSQRPSLWASAPGVAIEFPDIGVTFARLIDFGPAA